MKIYKTSLTEKQGFVEDMLARHHAELNSEEYVFDPQYDAFLEGEKQGVHFSVVVDNDEGVTVGYMSVWVYRDLINKNMNAASSSLIFLEKEYRKGTTAIRMIRKAEEVARDDYGVSVFNVELPVNSPVSRLYTARGYSPLQVLYQKNL